MLSQLRPSCLRPLLQPQLAAAASNALCRHTFPAVHPQMHQLSAVRTVIKEFIPAKLPTGIKLNTKLPTDDTLASSTKLKGMKQQAAADKAQKRAKKNERGAQNAVF
eukprot:GDKI01032266.1.p2 GENE.GDKI01032266.1~~GDKI01032266.1.p2  ORF type:complete len:107 (-),score=11.24 GDKI01032266.1:203-523(-)